MEEYKPEKDAHWKELLGKLVDPEAETKEHKLDPDLQRLAELADKVRFVKHGAMRWSEARWGCPGHSKAPSGFFTPDNDACTHCVCGAPADQHGSPPPEDRIPHWACDQWGAHEHDWLNCPDCLRVYEKWLDSEYAVLDGGTARDVVRRNAYQALDMAYDLLCCLWPEERALTGVIDAVDAARKAWHKAGDLGRAPK